METSLFVHGNEVWRLTADECDEERVPSEAYPVEVAVGYEVSPDDDGNSEYLPQLLKNDGEIVARRYYTDESGCDHYLAVLVRVNNERTLHRLLTSVENSPDDDEVLTEMPTR